MPRVTASIDAFLKSATAQAGMEAGITDDDAFRTAIGSDPGISYAIISGDDIDYTGVDDSTAAIHALIDAGIANGVYRYHFLEGSLKASLVLDGTRPGVILIGAGANQLNGDSPLEGSITRLIPADDAEPVISITSLAGHECYNLDIEGNGAGTSVAGLRIQNAGSTYPGMGFAGRRLRISGFTDGFRSTLANGVTLEDCSVTNCGRGYRGVTLSDTWVLTNCHGNYCTTAAVDVESPRTVKISGGDWGNTSVPLLIADGGGNVVWEGSNIESVNNARIFETSNSNLTVRDNRIDFSGNTAAVLVRQTTFNATVVIENNRLDNPADFGSYGLPLLWETNDATMTKQPAMIAQRGVCRMANADFSSTTRAWIHDRVNCLGYRTSNQTGMASGATTVVTYSAEEDPSGMLNAATGVATIPVDGRYQITCGVMLNAANNAAATNYTRIQEVINGSNFAIICNKMAALQYEGLNGSSPVRSLTAGTTVAIGIKHDKGSDMSLYATGAGEECFMSIVRLSD